MQFLMAFLEYDKSNYGEIVGINDLCDTKTLAHLLKYDSVYRVLDADIQAEEDGIIINGKKIRVTSIKDPAELPWEELGVEVVLESTGIFRTKENNSYNGHYFTESKKAKAIGPLYQVGSADVAFETIADSKEEARKKIEEAIKSGELK